MLNVFKGSGLRWLWVALVVLVADQLTKQIVLAEMGLYETIPVLPFFNLHHAHNYGAAFSLFHDQDGWQRWFFTIIAIGVSGLLLHWMRKTPVAMRLLPVAYALIIGGALGNLYDRLAYGFVVDFIQLFYQDWYYPTFNVADMAICAGAIMLVIDAFKNGSSEE